jgi:DNA-binding protein H-NS
MATYAELKSQAEALLREAEQLRRQEVQSVIAEIRAKMAEYGITPQELGVRLSAKPQRSRSKREVRYIGPNGEPWSGGPGRKPKWVREVLASGGDLEKYRVAESA